MNPEMIAKMLNQISDLQTNYDELKAAIAAMEIDSKLHLKANTLITPGIGCKVAWDSKGLILGFEPLASADIPQLSLSKINGLEELLQTFASRNELNKLAVSRDSFFALGPIRGTAIKVNYDDTGRIVSAADLLPEDIPLLPFEKIDGLKETIENIKKSIPSNIEVPPDVQSSPGTYTKVTINERGQVLGGDQLTIEDLPVDLVSRLKKVERQVGGCASAATLNEITAQMNDKVDVLPKPITPGKYIKVTVNSNGQVTDGEGLSRDDLPQIAAGDIVGLDRLLRDKANQSDLTAIQNTIGDLVSATDRLSEINRLSTELTQKAGISELKALSDQIAQVNNVIQSLNSIPLDQLMQQLTDVMESLETLTGRVGVLERKITGEEK